ncbi:MAG: hypothetical protein IJ672_00825, partial [Methanobrevibacter sp.]|nr:hypothetical protein [Methanobrevibacter sp.]
NLDINSNTYSVNVTDSKFTYNAGILNVGDYNVVLNSKGNNSNTYVFDKITKMFAVNRIDPGLSISISNITQGKKLKVNTTLSNMFETVNRTLINNITKERFNITVNKSDTVRIVYELNGNVYSKAQLENLTLNPGNYLVKAIYGGDKNYLPATVLGSVEVQKITPNITVNDVAANYAEEIKVNVTVDVADYYTVFIGNESSTLYVEDNAIFTFQSPDFKPGSYEIFVYLFESDDYAEAYANATLTVNKASGIFNLSNAIIEYGDNATVGVKVPVNASGNIAYKVYDEDMELVYSITQSCLEELVVPNLNIGRYTVTGAFEGDYYYTEDSIVNSSMIFVNTKGLGLSISISNIIYEQNADVNVKSNVDGKYIVYVGKQRFEVNVMNGAGSVSVPNLSVGSYDANVSVVDGNYSGFNSTTFVVSHKQIPVSVHVEDIVYGKNAVVNVTFEIDGEYLVYVDGNPHAITVSGGRGSTIVDGLAAGSHVAKVNIVIGNYIAINSISFNVSPKPIDVLISVEDIEYGEDACIIVVSEIDGEYLVYVDGNPYTVTVYEGIGSTTVEALAVGSHVANVTVVNGNYYGFN